MRPGDVGSIVTQTIYPSGSPTSRDRVETPTSAAFETFRPVRLNLVKSHLSSACSWNPKRAFRARYCSRAR
jgi:hypothetical protein